MLFQSHTNGLADHHGQKLDNLQDQMEASEDLRSVAKRAVRHKRGLSKQHRSTCHR